MTITYELSEDKKIIFRNNEDGSLSLIPTDKANSDYQRYLRWLENPDAEEHLQTIVPPTGDAE